jgi:phosphohistidine phosphatase
LLVSSPAKRALKTAKLFAKALGYPRQAIQIQEALYAGRLDTLQALVATLDERCSRACLFGHNPELSALLQSLSDERLVDLPTCGMACIEFAQDAWRACGEAQGRLAWLERPPKLSQLAL